MIRATARGPATTYGSVLAVWSFGLEGIKTRHVFSDGCRNPQLRRPSTASPTSLPVMSVLYRFFAVLALAVAFVAAERHVVSFNNGLVAAFSNPRNCH